jgi:hypothetical protein
MIKPHPLTLENKELLPYVRYRYSFYAEDLTIVLIKKFYFLCRALINNDQFRKPTILIRDEDNNKDYTHFDDEISMIDKLIEMYNEGQEPFGELWREREHDFLGMSIFTSRYLKNSIVISFRHHCKTQKDYEDLEKFLTEDSINFFKENNLYPYLMQSEVYEICDEVNKKFYPTLWNYQKSQQKKEIRKYFNRNPIEREYLADLFYGYGNQSTNENFDIFPGINTPQFADDQNINFGGLPLVPFDNWEFMLDLPLYKCEILPNGGCAFQITKDVSLWSEDKEYTKAFFKFFYAYNEKVREYFFSLPIEVQQQKLQALKGRMRGGQKVETLVEEVREWAIKNSYNEGSYTDAIEDV